LAESDRRELCTKGLPQTAWTEFRGPVIGVDKDTGLPTALYAVITRLDGMLWTTSSRRLVRAMRPMDSIEKNTLNLRASEAPDWRRLRERVVASNLDPRHVAVADLFPDDVDQLFGILVALDGRAFKFALELGPRGDLRRRWEEVQTSEWEEITSTDLRDRYRRVIDPALQSLQSQGVHRHVT
jgi:hypothetical protein